MKLVITCEHGGNRVPREYRRLFAGGQGSGRVLTSHRAWDPGALKLARQLAREFRAPLVAATVSRLVVDLNRSLSNPTVFSDWTRGLDADERTALIARYYAPHRERVTTLVRQATRSGPVVHVAVHSFTPVFRGVRRDADIGLLYDPSRRPEREFCAAWAAALRAVRPPWRVRMNYPYRGTSDGLTTALRREHAAAEYLGIELEINQRLVRAPAWPAVQHAIVHSLRAIVSEGRGASSARKAGRK